MIKSQAAFTADPSGLITTCAPNGTNVQILSGPNTAGEVQSVAGLPLTLPTSNGMGVGVVLPQISWLGSEYQPVASDLLIVNQSDFQIWLAFGVPVGTTLVAPTGPAPPVGPNYAGGLVVPAQSDVLLTTYANVAAAASNVSQVITGAMALAASTAQYASIYSTGTSGTVSFMRGRSNVQYIF
jgi:hypothetical protein